MNFSIKKIVLLTTMLCALLGVANIGYAATEDPWGPQPYTPYDAVVFVNNSGINAENMVWSDDLLWTASVNDAWELEFRPYKISSGNFVNPNEIFSKSGASLVTNLPYAYKEFDENDISIGTRKVTSVIPENTYYAAQNLTKITNDLYAYAYNVESEIGLDLIFDMLPHRYEVYYGIEAGRYYHW